MRQFLYISPYFAPQSQVGALRPLKFSRHLPALGWQPVILADLWPSDRTDRAMLQQVPADALVIRDYSAKAAPTWQSWQTQGDGAQPTENKPKLASWTDRNLPAWLNNPELVPLGEHSVDLPHARQAALKVIRDYPGIEAIVVNADPYAALLLGADLKRSTGLPLVLDLRDPWSVCQARRPRRPLPMRWLEDRLERWCVERADRVILNTANTLADYLRHYADLPTDKFTFIRNHFDRELVNQGTHPGFDRFTLLFLGRFDRLLPPDMLLQVLVELARRGVAPEQLQLVITGDFSQAAWQQARALGVDRYVVLHPHVPYHAIGPVMAAADLLVLMVVPGVTQRVNAKFYDYMSAERPVLAIADNPEVEQMLNDSAAGQMLRHGDVAGVADAVQAELARGRQRAVPRQPIGVSSPEAAAKLAQILQQVARPK